MVKKNFLKSSLVIALAVVTALTVAVMLPNKVSAASNDSESVSLTYSAHMQTYGDGRVVEAGNEVTETPTSFAGVTGESKRMESLAIAFEGPEGVTLKYQAHVQGIGWQDVVTITKDNTTFIGTKGQSKRVEAVKITVAGLDKLTKAGYAIKYRAHVQGEGWQDWMTADDKAYNEEEINFAGTIGESKRIEAIEIVLVHVHQNTYTHKEVKDGVSYHIRKCTICNEVVTEPCEYGEWDSTDGTNATRECLCGHKESTTLQKVLNDETITEVDVDEVNSKLTIPEGKTLTAEKLESNANVKVIGTLVLTGQSNSSATLTGKGTVIWAPEANTKSEFTSNCGKLFDYLTLSSGLSKAKNTLNYEIKLPELSESQKLTSTEQITIGKGYNITLDLGKNEIATKELQTGALFENKGNLTIKNGTLTYNAKSAGADTYAIINKEDSDKPGTLTLEGVTINTNGRGVATKGILNMKDCTITGKKNENSAGLVVGYTTTSEFQTSTIDMKKYPVTLDNVTMNKVNAGIYVHATNAAITLNDVNITSTGTFALHTNAKSSAANNSFTVNGGTFTSKGTVAYLAATGTHTFTNCTLTGPNGVEATGTDLTLDGVTINASGAFVETPTAGNGQTTATGSAVILKLRSNYGSKPGINLTVTNSKLTSSKGYAVDVVGDANLNSAVKSVNISYDAASYRDSNGAKGVQRVATSVEKITNTTFGVEE